MGLLRKFIDNPVLANMLTILILIGGVVAWFSIPRELFPEFSTDLITVTVTYPRASPAEIEESITQKIEEKVNGLEGVKEVTTTAREGVGVVNLELYTGTDVAKLLDEVKSEVDKIDLPLDAEDPTTVEVTLRRHIIHVAVASETDPQTGKDRVSARVLKQFAEQIRDDLQDLPEISQVSVSGTREYEISVEVSEETLRRYGLTLNEIAAVIRRSSFDIPAGNVKTRGGEFAIRIIGQRRWAEEFRDIVVRSLPDGQTLTLGQIASIRETFEDKDVGGQFGGKNAVLVSAYKTEEEDSIEIANAVKDYVARKSKQLPDGVTIGTWADYSRLISDRLDLLVRNGFWGIILVIAILWIFVGARLAFWVSLGIPVSLMGTMIVLSGAGVSLNMMSMFALIMALGLIVDDAIVVGENVFAETQAGRNRREAAYRGTKMVVWPVVGAVATTWLAFVPLLFIEGTMGRFISILPVVVITALAFSLFECLLILPPHLAHKPLGTIGGSIRAGAPDWLGRPAGKLSAGYLGMRGRIEGGIQWFIDRAFLPVHKFAVRYRYATLAVFASMLILLGGAFAGGHIKRTLFPKVDSDTVVANLVMPTGTSITRTGKLARQINLGALKLNEQFETEDGSPLVRNVYSLLGEQSRGGDAGSHVAEIIVELAPAEVRRQESKQIVDQWRQNVGQLAGPLKLTYGSQRGGPGGKSFEVRLLGPNTDFIKPAAAQLKQRLARFEGVTDIEDDALPGKDEIQISLRPKQAETLGVTLESLAGHVRSAFEGFETVDIQRGRDEVEVNVRYPESRRRSLSDLEQMRILTPARARVPIAAVADLRIRQGYTTLRRVGRQSVVTVSADLNEDVANAEEILNKLQQEDYFTDLMAAYPGLKYDLRGQRQQRAESLGSLKVWYPVALVGIYTILAAIFRSYFQPLIIMVAIPFGLLGAVLGHAIMGIDITLLSLFGMVALTGIVVNDSLVLIDLVNRRYREGRGVLESVFSGARDRFRAIFLTTATTVAGMTPLLLEQSFQAQFLKPMVVSLAFGLMFATLLTLIVVPCLYVAGDDIRRVLSWLITGNWRAHRSPEAPVDSGHVGYSAADAYDPVDRT
ncbi:MAG: efflux RND transporter permease subunit [Phycisphaerae bacterium]